jgi:hypothetical protein
MAGHHEWYPMANSRLPSGNATGKDPMRMDDVEVAPDLDGSFCQGADQTRHLSQH